MAVLLAVGASGLAAAPSDGPALQETIMPLTGWQLGRLDGNRLHCVELDFKTSTWKACAPGGVPTLEAGAQRVLANERTVAIVFADHVDFFDENGKLKTGKRLALTTPVRPETFVTGTASTENDLLRITGSRYVAIDAEEPEKPFDVALDCVAAEARKPYGFGGPFSLAVVGARDVKFLDLRRAEPPHAPGTVCLQAQTPDFVIPPEADEVFVYQRTFVGVRKGSTIRFFDIDRHAGWGPATLWTPSKTMVLPDLVWP